MENDQEKPTVSSPTCTALLCSFCEKASDDVEFLIAAPHANICTECVTRCNDVIDEQRWKAKDS
jgi:hypothetical protein